MARRDNFNRGLGAATALESTATPSDGGSNWVHDGLVAGAIRVTTGNQIENVNTGLPSCYTFDLGNQEQYVKAKVVNVTTSTGPFMICRHVDRDNWVGIRAGNGGANGQIEVYHRSTGGTMTGIYTSAASAVAVNDILELRISGNKAWSVYKNGSLVTSGTYSGTFPSSTRTGLASRSTAFNPWLDDFETGVIGESEWQGSTLALPVTVTGAGAWSVGAGTTWAGSTRTISTNPSATAGAWAVQPRWQGTTAPIALTVFASAIWYTGAGTQGQRDPGTAERRQRLIILDRKEEDELEDEGEKIARKPWAARKKRKKFAREVAEEVAQAIGIFSAADEIYSAILPETVGVFHSGTEDVDAELQGAISDVIQAAETAAAKIKAADEEDEDVLLMAM